MEKSKSKKINKNKEIKKISSFFQEIIYFENIYQKIKFILFFTYSYIYNKLKLNTISFSKTCVYLFVCLSGADVLEKEINLRKLQKIRIRLKKKIKSKFD